MSAGVTGETRWTAILSTDMVGFSRLSRTLDNETVFRLLQEVLQLAQSSIIQHGGKVVDTAGDGLLASFGAPAALENAAAACCRAAFDFHQVLGHHSARLSRTYGVVPQFRTGIAGGVAMFARTPDDGIKLVGDAVNRAARLSALARPDDIILDEAVRAEAEGDIETHPQGPVTLKGYEAPVDIHHLTGIADHQSRFDSSRRRGLTDFFSRTDEIAQCLSAMADTDKPRVLLIRGVAGIGKSRLTHELLRRIGPARHSFVGQCTPQNQSQALRPVHDVLRQAGIAPKYPDPNPSDPHPDPLKHALGARILAQEQLQDLHDRQNALIVIEDAHWIDTATHDLIAALLRAPTMPLIVTARPEFTPGWASADHVVQIDLAPLARPDIRSIAETCLDQRISPQLARQIWEKSAGTPLIAEEIARALRQNKTLSAGPDGLELTTADALKMTGNLEQMILARVDALPGADRTLLEVASVIGRSFSPTLLSRVLEMPGLEKPTAKLAELIEETGPDTWQFSHALVRDAVYHRQLSGQRQAFHLRIAETLDALPDPDTASHNVLADHYAKANQPARAVHFLLQSARENLKIYAFEQVDRSLRTALAFIQADTRIVDENSLADLAVIWLRTLEQWGHFGKLITVAAQVLPWLDGADYTPKYAIARTLTAIANAHTRDYDTAQHLAESTLALAQQHGDDWGAAWARVALMRIYEETHRQPPAVVETLAAEIAPVAAATRDQHLAMSARYMLSSVYRSTGRRKQALRVAGEISDFATSHDDRRAQSYAGWAQALVFSIEGNPEAALETIKTIRQDVIPGSADDTVFGLISLYGRVMQTPHHDIAAELKAFQADALQRQDFNLVHPITWVMAVSHFQAGHLARGWRMLNRLLDQAGAAGNINVVRQALLLRAEVQMAACGLIDPQSEAPASRPRLPRDRPGGADAACYLWLRLTGKARAAADFDRLIALDPLKYGAAYARARIGLGLIARSRGQLSQAQTHLRAGIESAQSEDLHLLVQRAQSALENSPPD